MWNQMDISCNNWNDKKLTSKSNYLSHYLSVIAFVHDFFLCAANKLLHAAK
jgi:hypothetical protein